MLGVKPIRFVHTSRRQSKVMEISDGLQDRKWGCDDTVPRNSDTGTHFDSICISTATAM